MSRFCSADRRFLAFALCLLSISLVRAHAAEPKRILLLYTEEVTTPAVILFESGVLAALNEGLGGNVELYREQLYANQPPARLHEAIDWIRRRYRDRKIDVMICIGLIETGGMPTEVLEDVPGVYAGISPDPSFQHRLDGKSVIVWFMEDCSKTLELARHLQPKTRKVMFLSGDAPRDKVLEALVKEQLSTWRGPLELEYVSGLTFQQMRERVASVSSDTVLVPLALSRDQSGASFNGPDMVRLLSESANVPMYTFVDTYVGAGVVGGSVMGFKRIGQMAGQAGLQLLNGTRPQDIARDPISANYYLFDGRQLQRWGLSERDLPPGSVIDYRMPSLWESYRAYVVSTVVLILLLSLFVTLLLLERAFRKRASESLRQLSGRLINAQEQERSRMARDLHDDFNQRLGLLAFGLAQLSGKLPAAEATLQVHELWEQTNSLSRDIQRLSHELHPSTLEHLGLVEAARALCTEFSRKQAIEVHFTEHDVPAQLPEDVSLCLFRILQESLHNISKHSRAHFVKVGLAPGSGGVSLTVDDDGIGFDPATQGKNGLGLLSMNERVRLVRGSIQIDSSRGQGTKVKVRAAITAVEMPENVSASERPQSFNKPQVEER